jgi:tripartite-type tricarboxylate transporter receptor subunit TctC
VTRMPSRRRVLSAAAALSATAALPRFGQAAADWRPTETIRIIVPAAAGGSTDVMGRFLAQHLQAAWGQSAIVENRSGGGGTIGAAEVTRQKGDGHTILIGNPGPNATEARRISRPRGLLAALAFPTLPTKQQSRE